MAPPIAADPGGFPDFRIFYYFSENVNFGDFPVGFGVWEGLQWIGNGCGLQMDGFSAHFEPPESIFDDFHDFGHFAIDSVGRLFGIPDFRIFGIPEIRNSGNPEVRNYGFPDLPEVRIFGIADFRKSEFPNYRYRIHVTGN